jgi:hypothetical protein
MAEYRDVLARPELRIRKGLRQQILQLIANRARSVTPASVLRVPEFWTKTKVITSREFVSIVAPHLT